jgi:4'-phosphopantetheinyl transferase
MIDQEVAGNIHLNPWLRPPRQLVLAGDEVHLWRVRLDVPDQERERLGHFLSNDELDRANRFHFTGDRERFIVTRGALRVILSGYQNMPPEQLAFGYSHYGKPILASQPHQIEFNLSHSHTLLLVAVSAGRAVGVDLEYLRPLADFEGIAKSTFSASENEALVAVPERLRLKSFFTCWTRKEAFIKALGQGLSYPLNQFEVSLKPGEAAALLRVNNDPTATARWSMVALTPAPDYVGTLVVESCECVLRFWQY